LFRGIYNSVAAMMVQESAVDVASNNLANVETSGFSKSLALAKAYPEGDLFLKEKGGSPPLDFSGKTLGKAGLGVVLSETAVDNSPGTIKTTDNPFDCAIEGDGYFRVSDGRNNYYTRAGAFSLDADGNIVTQSGLLLQGEGGAITPGDETDISIGSDGIVMADGEEIGRVAIFRFETPSRLLRRGNSLLAETEGSGVPEQLDVDEVRLLTGALEGSNVNVVDEMARMIEANRAYEAASKTFESGSESAREMIETFGS